MFKRLQIQISKGSRKMGVALALLFLGLVCGCGQGPEGAKPGGDKKNVAVVVDVATPATALVCDYRDFTGRLEAYRIVDLKPRVSGYLMPNQDRKDGMYFTDGQFVKGPEGDYPGDLLFQIDPRTYRADLEQAEGNLKQAEAEQQLQEKNANRARQMYTNRAINREELDQILAASEKAGATVLAMKAARDRARVNLGYTEIRAPLSGRISRRNVDPGNLVTADTTLLTTLVAENPVYATFDVDERTFLQLWETAQWARTSDSQNLELPVLMRLAHEDEFANRPERVGKTTFLDNRVSATTGTIRMRADFFNPGGLYKAGLFVRIRLPVEVPEEATLIPDEAIINDQGRKAIYVVRKDNTVEYRAVKIGQSLKGLRVLLPIEEQKDGKKVKVPVLNRDELVVLHGIQQLRKDSQVEVRDRVETQAPQTPPLVKLLRDKQQRPTS